MLFHFQVFSASWDVIFGDWAPVFPAPKDPLAIPAPVVHLLLKAVLSKLQARENYLGMIPCP